MTEIDFFDIVQGQAAAFLLVLTRMSGIFLISPFFGSLNIPVQIRAVAALAMTLIIFPVIVKETVVTAPETILMFGGTVVQELFIGWLIGFVAYEYVRKNYGYAGWFFRSKRHGSDFRSAGSAYRKFYL